MKIRNGFVSNSSSSSFIAVGSGGYNNKVEKKRWEDLLVAMGMPTEPYDYDDFYSQSESPYAGKAGDYGYGTMKLTDGSDICLYGGYEFWFAGFDALPLIQKDIKLSDIKKQFQKTVKDRYGMKLKLSDIKLVSETVSSE